MHISLVRIFCICYLEAWMKHEQTSKTSYPLLHTFYYFMLFFYLLKQRVCVCIISLLHCYYGSIIIAPSWPFLSGFLYHSNTVKNLTNEKRDNSASRLAHSLKVSNESDKIAAVIQPWYRAVKFCPCSLERRQLLEAATGRDVRFWKIKPMKAYKLRLLN